MKIIIAVLLLCTASAWGQITTIAGTDLVKNSRATINTNFANVVAKFSGAGDPAAVTGSRAGDLYRNTTSKNLFLCNVTPCAAAEDWTGLLALTGGTLSGNLLFSADNTHDIGASGATRPRNVHVAGTVVTGNVGINTGGAIQFSNLLMDAPSNGVMLIRNYAGTDFSRLQLGGTTSAFPSIKRNATAINFRLADDSADAPITASTITASSTASAAPGGTVGAWAKYTVEDSDSIFLAAGTSVTKTLVALPAKAVVEGIRIKTSEAFAGTGITACTVSLGDGTTATAYAAAFDVFAAVSDTNQAWDGGAYSATNAAHNLVATFTCNTNVGDGGATVLTAGSVDIHVKWAVLP